MIKLNLLSLLISSLTLFYMLWTLITDKPPFSYYLFRSDCISRFVCDRFVNINSIIISVLHDFKSFRRLLDRMYYCLTTLWFTIIYVLQWQNYYHCNMLIISGYKLATKGSSYFYLEKVFHYCLYFTQCVLIV